MAFYNLTDLTQQVIRRLRQVQGASTQLYSEDVIADYLRETYEVARAQRWWDHLTTFTTRVLDGSTGMITAGIDGLRDGYRDIQNIRYGNSSSPLPLVTSADNPLRWTGTTPRAVEPLSSDNVNYVTKPFRIWPLASLTAAPNLLLIRYRRDPVGIFTDPSVVIPFDSMLLVIGAALRYASDEGSAPSQVALLDRTFTDRLQQLQQQHDTQVIPKDGRLDTMGLTQWTELPN